MELPGDEASRRRQGDALVVVRNRGRNLLGTLRTLKPLRENTSSVADQTAEPVNM